MKHTTALFTLALATTGLAAPSIVARETQYVYIGKNANFLPSPGNAPGSDAVNIPVTVGDCSMLFPPFFLPTLPFQLLLTYRAQPTCPPTTAVNSPPSRPTALSNATSMGM
jgi:hypothetical protein